MPELPRTEHPSVWMSHHVAPFDPATVDLSRGGDEQPVDPVRAELERWSPREPRQSAAGLDEAVESPDTEQRFAHGDREVDEDAPFLPGAGRRVDGLGAVLHIGL